MSARQHLERLCQAHGVPWRLAERLLPLLEQGQRATPRVRARLVALVESALRAQKAELEEVEALEGRLEEGCLALVARMLHRWR